MLTSAEETENLWTIIFLFSRERFSLVLLLRRDVHSFLSSYSCESILFEMHISNDTNQTLSKVLL